MVFGGSWLFLVVIVGSLVDLGGSWCDFWFLVVILRFGDFWRFVVFFGVFWWFLWNVGQYTRLLVVLSGS